MIIGTLLLLLIFVLNLIYVTQMLDNIYEETQIERYPIISLLISIGLAIGIVFISRKLKRISLTKPVKITIFITLIIIYLTGQICWINIREATPITDQAQVYNLAKALYEKKEPERKKEKVDLKYFERYPQQLTLVWVYTNLFKLANSSNIVLLQYVNAIANTLSMVGIVLLIKQLEKQYKINMIKGLLVFITFLTLPLLSTFIYGDMLSIPMCLFAIYFIMQYKNKKQIRYVVVSAIFMAIAYILKMNSLIYLIAIVLYFTMYLLEKPEKTIKGVAKEACLLFLFIIISLLPTFFLKTTLQEKLALNKDKKFPMTGFIYMGMEESFRGNGWYNAKITHLATKDIDTANEQYKIAIKDRITKLLKEPLYTLLFYRDKMISMWTENTYEALWQNQSFNFMYPWESDQLLDQKMREVRWSMIVYQKALVLVIVGSTILVIWQNRKKVTNEFLLLLIIFIGGNLFHLMWEAKARYVITYLLILIPLSTICIERKEVSDDRLRNQ